MERLLISRAEALASGLSRYFTGKPCPYGHISERRVTGRECYGCFLERKKIYNSTERARNLARMAQKRRRSQPTYKRNRYERKTPLIVLKDALRNALYRKPSKNPATINDLIDMWVNQNGCCALSGIKMTVGGNNGVPRETSLSLDRIDNSRGYEADNLRLVCHAINTFRQRMTDQQMIEMARTLVSYHDRMNLTLNALPGVADRARGDLS